MDSLTSGLRRFVRNEHVILSVLAVALGGLSALAVIAFRMGIGGVQLLGFGFTHEFVVTGTAGLPWWQLLAVPSLGGLLVGLFLHWAIKGGRAHGVAQVIQGSAMPTGALSLRDGIASTIAAAVSIGAGASTGREGPVVHLSATLGAVVARRLRLPHGSGRTLLGCGAAAAVAASFNAPIAGVFFALEVIMRHHSLRAIAPIVISSVTATIISRAEYGNAPAFVLPDVVLQSLWEFPAFVILGIVAAIAAIAFSRSIFVAETAAVRSGLPGWSRPAVAGLAVGAIAILAPQVLGVGYEATDATLRADFGFTLLLVLIVAKFLATAVSLGFGFGGGVFSPALFLGSMIGAAFGIVAGTVFPELFSGSSTYAVIGMGAMAGAVLGSPMSTILIVFELTGDYTLTVAVMIATVVASLLTQQLYSRSFFHAQLERRGLHFAHALDEGLLKGMTVSSVMDAGCPTLQSDEGVAGVAEQLARTPRQDAVVVDTDGRFVGTVAYADVAKTSHNSSGKAGELASARTAAVVETDDLQTALDLLRAEHTDHLPVIRDNTSCHVVGIVRETAILRALLQARSEEAGDT